MSNNSLPLDDNYHPVLGLYNDADGKIYPVHVGSTVTGADGKTYAVLDVNAEVVASSNQRVNTHAGDVAAGSFVSGSILAGALADGADVAQGTTTQTKATDATTTSWSVIQLLKGIFNTLLVGVQLFSRSTVAVYTLASVTTSGSTQNSGDFTVGPYTEISIDINTTAQAGTTPTIQYFYERKAADGIYYVLWQSAVLTVATNTLSTSIGAGMAYNQSLGVTGRLRWVIGGSSTPTFTHTANIQGK